MSLVSSLLLRYNNETFTTSSRNCNPTLHHLQLPVNQYKTYLYPSFVQFRTPCQLLSAVYVWIVTLGEGCLQFRQLFLCEGRAMSSPRRRRTRGRSGSVAGVLGSPRRYGADRTATRGLWLRLEFLESSIWKRKYTFNYYSSLNKT